MSADNFADGHKDDSAGDTAAKPVDKGDGLGGETVVIGGAGDGSGGETVVIADAGRTDALGGETVVIGAMGAGADTSDGLSGETVVIGGAGADLGEETVVIADAGRTDSLGGETVVIRHPGAAGPASAGAVADGPADAIAGGAAAGPVARRRYLRWAVPAAAGILLAAVLSIVLVTQVGGNAACAAPISGKASYYSTNRNGMCNLGAPSTDAYVAIGPAEYAGGSACGSYLTVTGPNGTTTTVQVVDQCPSCPRGKIDLSKAAFGRIGELSAGIIPVTYEPARDPEVPGPLRVKLKGGTNRSSLTAVVDNHGNPLAAVELETPTGWTPLRRGVDNVWTGPSGVVPAPVTLRISDVYGHQAVVGGLALGPSDFQQTGTHLYGPEASPSAAPSESPSAEATASPSAAASVIAADASGAPAGGAPAPSC
ncbi:hypothetical protein GCM10010399_36490 [Dactylosporangium fulvum]|uniref:RlpA-like protein double-psi beta-barrel domain-containing protein n=1 Tax=Dactylosporangium fulvum TaxID=53359 RepID=A0ABY5WBC4_9ACTN|nr:expansin EXLX1 family cellulose-binding protein [Dactylosporangium fulvum]UWP86416.1 hypothetical protein Dfulv_20105 [Dactylosporangium fulvum]